MKKRSEYTCRQCGYRSLKWLGRCPECGEWECLFKDQTTRLAPNGPGDYAAPVPLTDLPEAAEKRFATNIGELDRVLGGGVVPGSVILLGGDPGIGKSTLILQMLASYADQGRQALYISGEESSHQIKQRGKRLGALRDRVFLATESNVERIVAMTQDQLPAILAIDSIQTMNCADVSSASGSVSQVRESAGRLLEVAKTSNIAVVLIGHVTKEGTLAGPRVLEHMVDTVLYFEGDRSHSYRIVRTVKNRYGPTNEIGVFEMKSEGLEPVTNPSKLFLAERPIDAPGSVVLPSLEGTRPILVEVQALVSPTNLGTARRTAIGADSQRLALLCAVLEKKVGMDLYGHDIYLNIVGGIRVDEPALDLGVICALVSSLQEKSIPADMVVCGEVGLAGEVRAARNIETRLIEAQRQGFQTFVMPRSNAEHVKNIPGIAVFGVSNIPEVLAAVLLSKPSSIR